MSKLKGIAIIPLLIVGIVCALSTSVSAQRLDWIGATVGDGVSGRRTLVQVWNPSTSGKIVVVERIEVAYMSSGGFYSAFGADLRFVTSPLATLKYRVSNKDILQAEGVAELRVATVLPANVPDTRTRYEFFWFGAQNNISASNGGSEIKGFSFSPGLRIRPGYGIVVATFKPDNSSEPTVWLPVNFQGYEEPMP